MEKFLQWMKAVALVAVALVAFAIILDFVKTHLTRGE